MQTYLRSSLLVRAKDFPYKAPEHVEKIAEELRNRCKQYEVKTGGIYLIPVTSEEYQSILDFRNKYSDFDSGNMFYEHKFTKQEISNAEYYLLKCTAAPAEVFYNELITFERCCNFSKLRGKQIKCYKTGKGTMKNKVILLSYDGRYILSHEARKAIEEERCTNFKVLPVYDTKEKDILAYQLCENEILPSLAGCNNWSIHDKCSNCGHTEWEGILKASHPFYMPKEWKNTLQDFNYTEEQFAAGSRLCIISKKVYLLLLQLGAKKIPCEPIIFV